MPVSDTRGQAITALFPKAELREILGPERARVGGQLQYQVLLRNGGCIGTIGLLWGANQSDTLKVGEGEDWQILAATEMPPEQAPVVSFVPFHVGRNRLNVSQPGDTRSATPTETVFITRGGATSPGFTHQLAIWGAPLQDFIGLAVATRITARGFALPPDGTAPPATIFGTQFRDHDLATMEFQDLQFLYIATTSLSSTETFAVVVDGVLVERDTDEYIFNPAVESALVPLRVPAAIERRLGLPALSEALRGRVEALAASATLSPEAHRLYEQAVAMGGR